MTEIFIKGFYNDYHILYVDVGLSLKTYIEILVLIVCVDTVGRWLPIDIKVAIEGWL